MNEALVLLDSITILSIVKLLIVVLLLVYALFAYLMMRMTNSMIKAVTVRDNYIIKILAFGHFIAAAVVLVLSIVVL